MYVRAYLLIDCTKYDIFKWLLLSGTGTYGLGLRLYPTLWEDKAGIITIKNKYIGNLQKY